MPGYVSNVFQSIVKKRFGQPPGADQSAAQPGAAQSADSTMAKRSSDMYGAAELLTPGPRQPTTLDERRSRIADFTGARQTQEAGDAATDLDLERRRRIRMMGSTSASYQSLFNSNGNMF